MNRSTRRLGVSAAAFALGVTGVLAATGPAQAREPGRQLQTDLNGAEEAPVTGDPDGSGDATITVLPGKNAQVCWDVSVEDIANPTAGHLHEAPAGSAGPVVVGFPNATSPDFAGCATVTKELAKDIITRTSLALLSAASFPATDLRLPITAPPPHWRLLTRSRSRCRFRGHRAASGEHAPPGRQPAACTQGG